MNESVTVSILVGFVLFCILSLRFSSQMAAILAWIVRSISGSRRTEESVEFNEQDSKSGKIKSDKPENSKVKCFLETEQPTFNTKLSTPIEDLIEETINEENYVNKSLATTNKSKKKKKSAKKDKNTIKYVNEQPEDISSREVSHVGNKKKLKSSDQITDTHKNQSNSEEDTEESFFTVKEKSRKRKNKPLLQKQNSEEAIQTVITKSVVKKTQFSRPSIIDHYKQKEVAGVKTEIVSSSNEFIQDSVISNELCLNLTKTEYKKSKQVTTNISYASVLTNSIPDNIEKSQDNYSETTAGELFRQQKELNEVSSSIEVLSEFSEDLDIKSEVTEVIQEDILAENTYKPIEFQLINQPKSIENITLPLENSFELIQNLGDAINIDSQFKESVLSIVLKESDSSWKANSGIQDQSDLSESNTLLIEENTTNPLESEECSSEQALQIIIDKLINEESGPSNIVQSEKYLIHESNTTENISKIWNENKQFLSELEFDKHFQKQQVIECNNTTECIPNNSEILLDSKGDSFVIQEASTFLQRESLAQSKFERESDISEERKTLKELNTNNHSPDFKNNLDINQVTQEVPVIGKTSLLLQTQINFTAEVESAKLQANNQNIELFEEQVQDLEDQIVDEPFVIEERDIILADNSVNSENNSYELKCPLKNHKEDKESDLRTSECNTGSKESFKKDNNTNYHEDIHQFSVTENHFACEIKAHFQSEAFKDINTSQGNDQITILVESLEDQIQDLKDQIVDEPFVIEERELLSKNSLEKEKISESKEADIEHIEHFIESQRSVPDNQNLECNNPLEDQIVEEYFFVEGELNQVHQFPNTDKGRFRVLSQCEEISGSEISTVKADLQVNAQDTIYLNLLKDQIQEFDNQIAEEQFFVENKVESNVDLENNLKEEIITQKVDSYCLIENLSDQIQGLEDNAGILLHTETVSPVIDIIKQSISQKSPFENMTQIRILTLNDKEHQESTIYRIEKNFILQFRLGPSLLGRKIKLYCNYPKDSREFHRGTYQLLEWGQDEGCKNADDTALFTSIQAKIAGSFHYYFIYENEDTQERQGSGYFLVDPVLKYGSSEELPLDCIQCQTVLAKQLGSFSTWTKKIQVSKESGYNIIHFTPIQELGASNSSYSLSEQLKLNPLFNEESGKIITFEDVEEFTQHIRKEWKILSICDIVLNHTANESKWLKHHPEVTYNCLNCPYMRSAYLLDVALHIFSIDIKKGNYENCGIPIEVCTEEHLNAIRYHFKTQVLESLNIPELFTVDVNKYLEEFLCLARKTPPVTKNGNETIDELEVIQDPEYRRLKSNIDLELALKIYNVYRQDCFDEESRVKKCTEDLKNKLDSLNEEITRDVNDDLNAAVENVIAGIRYYRVQEDGPQFKDITESHPLIYRYFTDYGLPTSLRECEEIMYSDNGKYLMAHNGWVMNSDPLKNFAAPGTKIYIRRELIAWGDSVKLRYGDKPEDCPFLWDYMQKYVEITARIFDGVRLDNCHSTPIPVAEYLLDCARKIRPDLYVVAELFTNSDLTDNIFVNRLGITSLIREAMSAWDSHEEGRLVYRYGGMPVGSFYQPNVRPLVPMVAHALLLDLTHDNPSPIEKRSVFDLLPSSALVNMACCASGSNRGYDELVPHHIHVVDENRQYTEWSNEETVKNSRYVNRRSGIIAAKRAFNKLHFRLGKEGYNQVYVDQMNADIVAVTRHNPKTHSSFVLVSFTAFGHPDINAGNYQIDIKPLKIQGVLDEIILEASMIHINGSSGGSKFKKFENFIKDSTWINGLSEYEVLIKQHIQVNQSDIFEEVNSGEKNMFQLNFKNFKPGSVAVIKVSLPEEMRESILKVRDLINSISPKKDTEFKQIINRMTLADINRALYRCDQEERDEGNGFDAYNIPNFGPLVYCGLQGFISLLANIRPNNDLGHPFCGNLRDGNWMIDYMWKRLKVDEGTNELGQWVEENIKYLYSIPRYLIPCYFDIIVSGIYMNILDQSYSLMSNFVKNGSTFVRGLSLGSLQFGAYIRSADLPTLSPNLTSPKPPTRKNKNGESIQACVTLSAGLPHFSVGYMRNWGRDTFIALRGLFILTGRFEESRQHILGYAACLRHGLIPNLLDGGRNSRFNCRDAIWWWLYCIKSYCEEVPNGIQILSDKVSRIFPTDDSAAQRAGSLDQPLYDVIQESLKVHFQGLKFRERNAGRQIDEHMSDAGFNNQIGIHPETGFVFGGNQWNCGTWMDKMGSSDKAGNRGKPATPRDGSAVELVGLSKAAISWLRKLNQEGHYPYDGVERVHKNGSVTKWTFKAWSDKIEQNFERMFWIDIKPLNEETRHDLINKTNVYKDSFGASQPWTDYQLRCNFPIAMVAAPELFNPQHAWAALEQVEKYLLGPLGMKTLDPEDWNYRGDYDNSNDSNDFYIAHGFNYHQGPEWVWPVGFFLRAKLIFAAQNGKLQETVASTKIILSKHFTELQTSPWRGLPELTNSNGSYCRDSSRTQAWSMSCILEVLYDLQQAESKQLIVN